MNSARRTLIAITTLIVLVVVGLAGVFAAGASAGTLVRPQNVVAPIGVAGSQLVGVHQPVLAGQHRARAPDYDRMAVGSSVAAETGTGGGAANPLADTERVTAQLQGHVDAAAGNFDSGEIGMSDAQTRAAAGNPGLGAAYRGQVIDAAAKQSILEDPSLEGLYVTRSGEFGPDISDPSSGRWWDITTAGQWAAHVSKYADPFGTGYPLLTGGG